MDEIDIHIVRSQCLQAVICTDFHPVLAHPVVPEFGDDGQLFAVISLDRFADHLLRMAISIDIGRIDGGDTVLNAGADRLDRSLIFGPEEIGAADRPCPEDLLRDIYITVSQSFRIHQNPPSFMQRHLRSHIHA